MASFRTATDKYFRNIEGCVGKYQDIEAARSWLVRADHELDTELFASLIERIIIWFAEQTGLHGHAEGMAGLLGTFRSGSQERLLKEVRDAERSAREKQEDLARQASENRERIRREQEQLELMRAERERLRLQEAARDQARQRLREELRTLFSQDYPSCDEFYRSRCQAQIPHEEYLSMRRAFVKQWFAENLPEAEDGTTQLPDREQLEAIAAQDRQIQVVARAGSGKTSTIAHRVFFLIRHCSVPAHSILLLAFNRKAALELRKRLLLYLSGHTSAAIASRTKALMAGRAHARRDPVQLEEALTGKLAAEFGITLPHVMTFHALAYAVVHPRDDLLFDNEDQHSHKLSHAVQDIVYGHLRTPDTYALIRTLMLAHFRKDWEHITRENLYRSKQELLAFRRSLPHETLRGESVKSYGEKAIANFLFEHDIPYRYEQPHRWNGTAYRPDFTVYTRHGNTIIIEYFGLRGDPDYDRMSAAKRQFWAGRPGYTFLEFDPSHVSQNADGSFQEILKTALQRNGIACNRLSEDEIWEKIKDRSIIRFTRAMVTFIGRCRQLCIEPQDLLNRVHAYSTSNEVEQRFLRMATRIYADYAARLQATGEQDFNGLLQQAVAAIRSGRTSFIRKMASGDLRTLRHVFIDEFQDFSKLFFNLISTVKDQAPAANIFCVGDDWQAINGFAGSELCYFKEFERYLGEYKRLYISTNYRSCRRIVDIGNALMKDRGKPAKARKVLSGSVRHCYINRFSPTIIEAQRHADDQLTPVVLRILSKTLQGPGNAVLLCRKNMLPWPITTQEGEHPLHMTLPRYLVFLRSFFSEELRSRITISSAHRYKGLQRSTVILVDVLSRSYPLIHPDSIFTRILGDSEEKLIDADRRLLYVAMTRAVNELYILSDSLCPSPFLQELDCETISSDMDWDEYPAVGKDTGWILVTVGNQPGTGSAPTFALRAELGATGYSWQNEYACWVKSYPAKSFSLNGMQSEVWATKGNGLVVRVLDGQDQCLACFDVMGGRWSRRREADA